MRNQVKRGMYVLTIPKSTSIALFFHTNCRPVYATAHWTYFQPTYLQLNSHFPHALSHQIWSFLRFSSANSSPYTAIQVKNGNIILHSFPCLLYLFSHQILPILPPYYLLNASRWLHPMWHHAKAKPSKWNPLLQLSIAFYGGRRVYGAKKTEGIISYFHLEEKGIRDSFL